MLSAGRGPRPSSRCHGAAAVTVDCRLTTLNALSDLAIVGGHLKNLLSLLVTRRFQKLIVDIVPVVDSLRRHCLDKSLEQSLIVSLNLVLSLLLLL